MAKANVKSTTKITGIINITDDNQIFVEVEDEPTPINLATFISDYADKGCSITVSYACDIDDFSEYGI